MILWEVRRLGAVKDTRIVEDNRLENLERKMADLVEQVEKVVAQQDEQGGQMNTMLVWAGEFTAKVNKIWSWWSTAVGSDS